jgi:hypothetical protein
MKYLFNKQKVLYLQIMAIFRCIFVINLKYVI